MLILLLFAFISGLITILAPCIWPLLPVILSSSLASKSRARPLGITLGVMLSFAVFTLSVSFLIKLFHFNPNDLRLFAVVVLAFMGLTLVIPKLGAIIESAVSKLSGKLGAKGHIQGSGFAPGFITGLSLGIVWSPCAGPILSTIATFGATGQVTLSILLITFAYILGVGIPLFLFAYGGQRLVAKTRFMSAYIGRIQQVFGIVILLTALSIYTNFDKVLQLKLLDTFPQYRQILLQLENNRGVETQLDSLKGKER
ncbi:cytochrome c biogenesis protein CcdA [Candidatus Curtissbacteria bacterium]|nr:cytochrome c biogenesis protein CcdA [Candidatus Curtissbacteria bacterium]